MTPDLWKRIGRGEREREGGKEGERERERRREEREGERKKGELEK